MASTSVDRNGTVHDAGLRGIQPAEQAIDDRRYSSISVVIPTLNEAENLPYVLSRLPPMVSEVIIVDGHSTDGTISISVALGCRPDAKVVMQNRKGKGNALACGFRVSTGDITVTLDADGSTDPAEIPRFAAPLTNGYDFAKGTRFVIGGGSTSITPLRSLRGTGG